MSESRPNRARLADYYGVRRDSGKISDAIESKSQVNTYFGDLIRKEIHE